MAQFVQFNSKLGSALRFLLVFVFSVCLFVLPVAGQEPFEPLFRSNIAPVTLDGRAIFKVSGAENLTASERADMISSKLQQAVTSTQPIKGQVQQLNERPTIWLNNVYLLTVTQLDTENNIIPEYQANIWSSEIQAAIEKARQERSRQFLQEAVIKAVFVLLCGCLIHWGLGWFWHHYLEQVLKNLFHLEASEISSETHPYLDLLFGLMLVSARFALWLTVILYITNQFPYTRLVSFRLTETFISTFTSKIITINKIGYSIPDLLILGCLIWGLFILAKIITNILQSRILQATRISRGAQEVIAVIVRYFLVSIGTIVLLQVWGLDLSSLTIVASALGVGIGFGFQDIAKNFGSGLVLLFERPIQVGDFIEIGEYMGTVERVGARSTVIKTLDQVSIIVPNSRFLETEVTNWHYDSPLSGLRFPVIVSYHANVEIVKDLLLSAAQAHSEILSMPMPQVLFKGFGENSLNFELRVWTKKPSRQFQIRSEIYYKINALFRQYQIEIPFPQQDLHVKGKVPLELSPELKALISQLLQNQNHGNLNQWEESEQTQKEGEQF